MKVKIKRLHPDAVIPSYAKNGDAGLDLTATSKRIDLNSQIIEYGIGVAVEIPNGYVGLIYPRSSVYKTDLILSNCVGVVDSGYRGEIKFKFAVINEFDNILESVQDYDIGDRIGQLIIVPYPSIEFEEVEELSESERGLGGYGSTGR
jgi:dUTP pyrophosphatase